MRNAHACAAIAAALLYCLCASVPAAAQLNGAASCGMVLSQAIMNTESTTSSGSSWATASSYICNVNSDYSYNQYQQDSKSTQASSNYRNIAASAKYYNIEGSVSVETGKSELSENQFNTAMANVRSAQSSACSTSSSASSNAAFLTTLRTWLDARAYSAYVSCLKLQENGMSINLQAGTDSRTVGMEFKFAQGNTAGATAYMSGITMTPDGSATCTISASSLGAGRTLTRSNPGLNIRMANAEVFSVICTASGSYSGATDIWVTTTPGGVFKAAVFRSATPTAMSALHTRLAASEATARTLQSQLTAQQATINSLTAKLDALTAKLNDLASRAVTCDSTTCAIPAGKALAIGAFQIRIKDDGTDDLGIYHPEAIANHYVAAFCKTGCVATGKAGLVVNGDGSEPWWAKTNGDNQFTIFKPGAGTVTIRPDATILANRAQVGSVAVGVIEGVYKLNFGAIDVVAWENTKLAIYSWAYNDMWKSKRLEFFFDQGEKVGKHIIRYFNSNGGWAAISVP